MKKVSPSRSTKVPFTMVPNAILDKIISSDLSSERIRIVLLTLRKTYGFQSEQADLAAGYVASLTGGERSRVAADVRELLENRVLVEVEPPKFNSPRKMKVNKNVDEWNISRKSNGSTVCKNAQPAVGNSGHHINKRNKGIVSLAAEQQELPTELTTKPRFAEVWPRWLQHLAERGKHPTKPMLDAQLKKLATFQDPVAALENSIINGWSNIFPTEKHSVAELRGPLPRRHGQRKRLAASDPLADE